MLLSRDGFVRPIVLQSRDNVTMAHTMSHQNAAGNMAQKTLISACWKRHFWTEIRKMDDVTFLRLFYLVGVPNLSAVRAADFPENEDIHTYI